MLNHKAYLARIGYSGSLDPTPAVLRELHRAHLYTVPFENLDIALGRPIRLDEASLVDKIITHRRGGFCYELNGLFASLLRRLGYQVTLLNARGVNDDGSYSREFDHLALRVTCPDDPGTAWLADIGWGSGPLEPIRLEVGSEQRQAERSFRLVQANGYHILTELTPQGQWINHYAFTLQPHDLSDFSECCIYQQTAPDSFFTQKRLCTRFLPDGRVTLSDLHLITTLHNQREERDLKDEVEFKRVLADLFAIDLDLS